MSWLKCEVRKLSANIRTSAVVVVRLLYITAPRTTTLHLVEVRKWFPHHWERE